MISKIIEFEIAPHGLEEFRSALYALAKGSKAEPGCVHYAIFQDSEIVTFFTVLEQWKDEDAFEAHRKGAVLAQFKESADEFIHSKTGQSLLALA